MLRVFLIGAVALPAVADAQVSLLKSGDKVASIGTVQQPTHPVANDAGQWVCRAIAVDGNYGLVHDGVSLLVKDDTLAPGVIYNGAMHYGVDSAGDVLWAAHLDGAGTVGFQPTGIGRGNVLLRMAGDPCVATEVTPGTTYTRFGELSWNDVGEVLIVGSIDDPSVGVGEESALIVLQLDAAGIASERIAVKDGDVLTGQTTPVEFVGRADINIHGDLIYTVAVESGAKRVVYWNDAPLVQEGDASPLPGQNWAAFFDIATNDSGAQVILGSVTGGTPTDDGLIMRNGVKVVQEGDVLFDTAPDPIHTIWPTRIDLAPDGRVAWIGLWGSKGGLFLDDRLVIESGVTQVDGKTVLSIGFDGFDFTPDGEGIGVFLIFEGGATGSYLLRAATTTVHPGCGGNPGTLASVGALPIAGETLTLDMDGGQASGVVPYLGVSLAPAAGGPPCGIVLPGVGELMIDVASPNFVAVLGGGTLWTGTPVSFLVPLAADLLGIDIWFQGLFLDPSGFAGGQPVRMTNGLEAVVGI